MVSQKIIYIQEAIQSPVWKNIADSFSLKQMFMEEDCLASPKSILMSE